MLRECSLIGGSAGALRQMTSGIVELVIQLPVGDGDSGSAQVPGRRLT